MDATLTTQHFFNECIQYALLNKPMLDWPAHLDESLLRKYMNEHRLSMLFLHVLRKNNAAKGCLHPLGALFSHHIQNHLMMARSLLSISNAFKEKSIAHVVLKGIPLNAQLHGQQCVRISKDIDVLIDPNDLSCAHDRLLQLGYILCSELNPEQIARSYPVVLRALKDLTYRHPVSNVEIELHWGTTITHQFGFRLEDVGALDCCPLIKGQTVPILSPEYNFVYLCIHGAVSHWSRLQWLLDVAFFYQKVPLVWEKVIAIGKNHGGTRALLEASYLLEHGYGMHLKPIPSSGCDRMAIRIHLHYTQRIWKRLKPQNGTVSDLWRLWLYPRWYQKYDFVRNRLICRLPCRKKLAKNARYPRFLLLLIGLFSPERASAS
jgi:hypothetical protein